MKTLTQIIAIPIVMVVFAVMAINILNIHVANAWPEGKINICHKNGNGSYVSIVVDDNATHGHEHHDDLFLNIDQTCPNPTQTPTTTPPIVTPTSTPPVEDTPPSQTPSSTPPTTSTGSGSSAPSQPSSSSHSTSGSCLQYFPGTSNVTPCWAQSHEVITPQPSQEVSNPVVPFYPCTDKKCS